MARQQTVFVKGLTLTPGNCCASKYTSLFIQGVYNFGYALYNCFIFVYLFPTSTWQQIMFYLSVYDFFLVFISLEMFIYPFINHLVLDLFACENVCLCGRERGRVGE